MPDSAERKPLPPPDAELTLDEAAQQLREYWGYPAMTDFSLYVMIKKLDWGPAGHFREGFGWYMKQHELLSWLKLEKARAKARREIDDAEIRRDSARRRPLWCIFVVHECGRLEMVQEILAEYGCETTTRFDFESLESVLNEEKPDAMWIEGWGFNVYDTTRAIEAAAARGIYCVLAASPQEGVMTPQTLLQCSSFDGEFAQGGKISSIVSAPSHLARRMALNAGLDCEYKYAMKKLREDASNGYGFDDDESETLPELPA